MGRKQVTFVLFESIKIEFCDKETFDVTKFILVAETAGCGDWGTQVGKKIIDMQKAAVLHSPKNG